MNQAASKESSEKSWKPRGIWAWLLTPVASLLAVFMVTLALCMMHPVRWDGLGIIGALALYFPLHLLVVTLVAAVLAFVAMRCRARLAVAVFSLVVVLMAVTPWFRLAADIQDIRPGNHSFGNALFAGMSAQIKC